MLEYIVRPFASPQVQSTTLIPSSPATTTEKAHLSWGADGTIPDPVGIAVKTVCKKSNENEITRDWEDVKLFSQDDPENFITVRRATTMTFHKVSHDQCADGNQNTSFTPTASAALNDVDPNFGPAAASPVQSQEQVKYTLSNNTVAEKAPNPPQTGTTTSPDNTTDPVTGQAVGAIPTGPGP